MRMTLQEIQKLLAAALKLSPSYGLRPGTYYCLFGLLAVAGLRISEALKLEQPDVDLGKGILTIRQTKFGRTRLVSLHTSTRDVMAPLHPAPQAVSAEHIVSLLFSQRSRPSSGGREPEDHQGPRLHDFGTDLPFAHWRSGIGPTRISSGAWPVQSTFLGHGHAADTYWYHHA
jgi:integrase